MDIQSILILCVLLVMSAIGMIKLDNANPDKINVFKDFYIFKFIIYWVIAMSSTAMLTFNLVSGYG